MNAKTAVPLDTATVTLRAIIVSATAHHAAKIFSHAINPLAHGTLWINCDHLSTPC